MNFDPPARCGGADNFVTGAESEPLARCDEADDLPTGVRFEPLARCEGAAGFVTGVESCLFEAVLGVRDRIPFNGEGNCGGGGTPMGCGVGTPMGCGGGTPMGCATTDDN
ncbi:unnamed protein product [Cylicostephanus goldi]|uniref:Uncharacterized protein n=1 Tax=Cylicostephanus goldi TaxID=71465 RepID=A0A3P7QTV0_CYLGO|nr:unnamed protein product [Cylicostephanus goldi]